MTKLVLVNAIYFKGNWAEKFEEANTVEMPFRLNKVKQMHFSNTYIMTRSKNIGLKLKIYKIYLQVK